MNRIDRKSVTMVLPSHSFVIEIYSVKNSIHMPNKIKIMRGLLIFFDKYICIDYKLKENSYLFKLK